MSRQALLDTKSSIFAWIKANRSFYIHRKISSLTTRNVLKEEKVNTNWRWFANKDMKLCRITGIKQIHLSAQNRNEKTEEIENKDGTKKAILASEVNKLINQYKSFEEQTKMYHQRNNNGQEFSLKELLKKHPYPKSTVNSFYSIISAHLNVQNTLKVDYTYDKEKLTWTCNYTVKWPEEKVFSSTDKNKRHAASLTALKCLQWLHSIGKINSNHQPILYTKKDCYKLPHLDVNDEIVCDMKSIVSEYNENIKEIVKNELSQPNQCNNIHEEKVLFNYFNINPIVRNKQLVSRFQYGRQTPNLPILNYRNEIIKHLSTEQVFILQGDTGCGKTTQVPQIIMDHYTSKNMAASCNIIVIQPRRISSISIAERVAQERREEVGDVVGYEVRLDKKLPKYPGSILFCTTGIFRKKLQWFPSLEGISHVILDEAHERTVDTDILLVLLKKAMQLNPNLKVIVMSATINAELFQKYFNCPMIKIPGMLHPVKMHFLEDIAKLKMPQSLSNDDSSINFAAMANLIEYIVCKKPEGTILCFLPGWAEILRLQEMLQNQINQYPIKLIPLHSKLSMWDQKAIFNKLQPGIRKIILATDIAETGITIPDVVYVVDSATNKTIKWDEDKCVAALHMSLVTKSNIQQRKGRAGRVQAGESYHFISKKVYETLDQYPLPQIMCSSLHQVVLESKLYCNDKVEDFLSQVPNPPKISAINDAIAKLKRLELIDDDENLTHLGRRATTFSQHPTLSKALILSEIFGCLKPMLSIAAIFSSNSEMFAYHMTSKAQIRQVKSEYHPYSDHLACAWLFKESIQVAETRSPLDVHVFNVEHGLMKQPLNYINKIHDVLGHNLRLSRMIEQTDQYNDETKEFNKYIYSDELVGACLLGGTDQLITQIPYRMIKDEVKKALDFFISEDKQRSFLSPETVNYNRKVWPSPYLTYYIKTHSTERRGFVIRESTMISPLSVLLFVTGDLYVSPSRNETGVSTIEVTGKPNVKMTCDTEKLQSILEFRSIMWDVARYFFKTTGFVETIQGDNEFEKVSLFKRRMVEILSRALEEASEYESTEEQSEQNSNAR